MNPLVSETANVLTGGRVVGTGIRYEDYSRQEVPRGHPDFIIGRGDLMEFDRCPHRWIAGYESEDTKATEWGELVDCLALTPERFEEDFAVAPETYPDSKTGEPKPWTFAANFCKEWREEHKGQKIRKFETVQQAQNAVKILYDCPETREVLECSERQVMCVSEYHDEDTGLVVPVRILIDLLPRLGTPCWQSSLGDLKTCSSALGWHKTVYNCGYHVQAAFYVDVYQAATGEERPEFFHVVQESFPPWEPGRKILSSEFIELGRWRYQAALKRYAQCLKSQTWPGYGSELVEPKEPWMTQ